MYFDVIKKVIIFFNIFVLSIFYLPLKDIAQNTMLLEELFNVKSQLNATMYFPNVTSPTIPQRLTNVL